MLDAGDYRLRQGMLELMAGIALSRVDGASGVAMRGEVADEGKKRKNLAKGIKAEANEGAVTFEVEVHMDYGRDFHEVGREVQRAVKEAVESMTGWRVEAVDVNVTGVNAV
jgi:uncharacterized alkaline shock family protein YloU